MKRASEMNKIDYYNNFISYVKIIMETIAKENEIKTIENGSYNQALAVKEENLAKDIIIREIYNNFFNDNVGENKDNANISMTEMVITTALFENKLYTLSNVEKSALIKTVYDAYIKPMICSYSNGDINASLQLFDIMNERIKAIVGYNVLYGNDTFVKKNNRLM